MAARRYFFFKLFSSSIRPIIAIRPRHGREGISYPFLTRGGKYLPAPERAKNPLQSLFRVGFPARTRPFPSVSLRVPPCSVPPRSRSSFFCRRARICRTSPPRLPPRSEERRV